MIVSALGTGLGECVYGIYMLLKVWNYNVQPYSWIPLASFSLSVFISACALLSLPFVIVSEVMPNKLKEFGVSLSMSVLWALIFIMLKYLPLLIEVLSLHGSMFLFASCCLAGAAFIAYFMPETRGKSYEQIMKSLAPKSRTLDM